MYGVKEEKGFVSIRGNVVHRDSAHTFNYREDAQELADRLSAENNKEYVVAII